MSNRPLNLALFWHMHQPFYKDLVTGEYILPWVRLHAAKDYYDMVEILSRFPEVKVNFNLVPSLLFQVEDYANGVAKDKFLLLTLKDPADLTDDERMFILQHFFMANWETMIKPYRRYHDLLIKRGRFVPPSELVKVAKRFSLQELMDLQVWFNLAWFGFIYKFDDPAIAALLKKGKNFTPEDKLLVVNKQCEIAQKVIPAYRDACERGQAELTTSPFYHPILPLLCDTSIAREAIPHLDLPESPYRYPEDAEEQIRMALSYHASRFGKKPDGLWPSEGSVSEQIISIVSRAGVKWIATDEGILAETVRKIEGRHRSLSAQELYQPYLVEHEGQTVSMLFRNHFISDQVGFVYYRWKIEDAITDFKKHMHNIRVSLPDDGQNYLVCIILDGENAWEYYPDSGKHFLEAFYGSLQHDPELKTVKIAEYLQENPPRKRLNRLFAGSWINNNFRIWIGHVEDNTAWNYLNQARLALASSDCDKSSLAWQELFVAEGSDWCWWYGDDHSSENDPAFDSLFRTHLKNIYHLLQKPIPGYLDLPIKRMRLVRPLREPVYLIQPSLDGKITSYYEWLSAGHFDITKARGAMHQIETALQEIYYGFSKKELFIRLDLSFEPYIEEAKGFSYSILILNPEPYRADIAYLPDKKCFELHLTKVGQEKESQECLTSFAVGKIIELGLPFEKIQAKTGDRVEFVVVISHAGQELERWPKDGAITVFVPSEEYEMEQWSV